MFALLAAAVGAKGSVSKSTPTSASPLHVCLGSFTQPWSFGPYARQLTVLAGQLSQKHLVLWLSLGYQDTQVRVKVPGLPENVGMVGGGFPRNQGVYVSSINALLREHKMDVFITLMDLNRVFVDEMFEPLAISWFPNHFVALDLHSRHALTAYDAVAVLGPSDATSVLAQLPHKHVVHIPHVVDDVGGLGETPRAALRRKYGVPADKFVALVNFANYDAEKNRKSIDLSLLAWKVTCLLPTLLPFHSACLLASLLASLLPFIRTSLRPPCSPCSHSALTLFSPCSHLVTGLPRGVWRRGVALRARGEAAH